MEGPEVTIVSAHPVKRLFNYLIDLVLFSVLLTLFLAIVAPVYPLMNKILEQKPIDLSERFTVWFLYGLYMAVMEALLKGKTIGKYITGTRAVTEDGLPVGAQAAFIRGLIRVIPFEQISMVFFPPFMWHDIWSKTIVADEAKSNLPSSK